MTLESKGQIMSWYHSKILRIPHGKQIPKKRYLKENEILELFDGVIHIQEKVDGKLSCGDLFYDFNLVKCGLYEDMTGKNTCHEHIEYKNIPPNKRIYFDYLIIKEVPIIIDVKDKLQLLDYAVIDGPKLSIDQIFVILECFSRSPSHFGRERIEGLVIKNYEKQLMGKWINDEFEDHLKESKS